ncbi:MAG TPA: glycosyltransferase [Candidatus Binataceae bacterium]|nr:glycosyltransferase [Candidatus Binataceae bacterium]
MERPIARDKYFFVGPDKFEVRGVSYGPFAPNARGEPYPDSALVAADFARARELGANLLRLYAMPPEWLLELAARAELRLMVGVAWPSYVMVLDSPDLIKQVRLALVATIERMRPWREWLFAYCLANEIRPDVVRYHGVRRIRRFVRQLYRLGSSLDPEGLFTLAAYPPSQYLDLSFLDFACYNLYLHSLADFRNYLGHLQAQCGTRPLLVGETGLDTVRNGEAAQAALLPRLIAAGAETGVAGMILFALTDEWHTAGADITDWAFGLLTRQRHPKLAFAAVARQWTRPALVAAPMVSVVVAAYNAAQTLGSCLASLQALDYPAYEVIVVDDGSQDQSWEIARTAGVTVLRTSHRGLSAARNLGIAAARGEFVAFIDADAKADRDWLSQLIATMRHHRAAAAGGSVVAAPVATPLAAALAAAPGQATAVHLAGVRLLHLCGCNMAMQRRVLEAMGGFDPRFTTAGDDVDISRRLAAAGAAIMYAPGAVVHHRARASLFSYLSQQRGYGRAEAILGYKYRAAARPSQDRVGGRWKARIYRGEWGQGSFQSLYPASSDLIELPREFAWVTVAAAACLLGAWAPWLTALGACALMLTVLSAVSYARRARLAREYDRFAVRCRLGCLALIGPVCRGAARWVKRVGLAAARLRRS